MDCILLLTKEDLKLAESEFQAVMEREYSIDRDKIICVCSKKDIETATERLAYTKTIFELLISCEKKELEEELRRFNWEKICKQSYALRKIACDDLKDEKYYGSIIWKTLKDPKVDLKKAKTEIFLLCGKKVYVCRLVSETDKSYLERAKSMKPSIHPTATKPKLAKAMVNLTRAKKGDKIVDPFCGTGGILLEAARMGFEIQGIDISEKMLVMARQNLSKNNIKEFKLIEGDATNEKIDAKLIVTDLPYGRNSVITDHLEDLYSNFFKNIKKYGIQKAVIGFPDFVDYKKIIKNSGFDLEEEFDYYLHKTLSKKIVVIR